MTSAQTLPCFGGPLDGKRAPIAAVYHEAVVDGKTVRYSRMWYGRWFYLANGDVRLQKAHLFVFDEDYTADFKIPPERHGELDWTPTDEEIMRQAEAEGKI